MHAGAEITRVNSDNNTVRYRAYAKVNLALGVGRKRADGYHEISTVMVPVRVHDLIAVSAKDWSLLEYWPERAKISLACPSLSLPAEKNLAYKAALTFLQTVGITADISIAINKRVPTGAGMGGGSSDAAAVLVALNNMVPFNRALTTDDLIEVAAKIGADVPFFLGCDAFPPVWEGALCTGIGEKVQPMIVPEAWMVIVVPRPAVDTREAYQQWDEIHAESLDMPAAGHEIADPRMSVFLESITGGDPAAMGTALFNDLEDAVRESHPVIFEVKRTLLECGALGACMTGSGSAVFGLAGSEEAARELAGRVCRGVPGMNVKDIIVTRTGVDRNAC